MISLYAQSDFTTGFRHSSNNVNKPCPDIKVLYLLAQGLNSSCLTCQKVTGLNFVRIICFSKYNIHKIGTSEIAMDVAARCYVLKRINHLVTFFYHMSGQLPTSILFIFQFCILRMLFCLLLITTKLGKTIDSKMSV